MAFILDGKAVSAALQESVKTDVRSLSEKGVTPTLAIVRVGEKDDDVAYERGAVKRCAAMGVAVRKYVLDKNAKQNELLDVIDQINRDDGIHGCLLFRPLPKHIDDTLVRNALSPKKDVDGITDASLCKVFTGAGEGYPPCTAQACMEILDHYKIDVTGISATVVGRSLVVGKPAAMMLLQKNATVTVCHTKTKDMAAVCRKADLLLVAAGRAGMVTQEYLSEGQTVLDVGINVDPNGNVCGDVAPEAAQTVKAYTPVPGGVGTVTTTVLVKHVVLAAKAGL